jgi:glycosyltransferase involved in cell wall biosynthesis
MVHNFYRSGTPGGEDVAFAQERDLLQAAGHEVVCYTRSNDEMHELNPLDIVRTALDLHRSRRTERELGALLRDSRPAVAHFHNTFPLISESGFEVCRSLDVPVVQTLHNYRFTCIAATHFRDGAVCEACVPGDARPAVQHRCYRNLPASVALAWSTVRNHAARRHGARVDRYFALNRFMAGRLCDAGVPESRIVIKPNFAKPPSIESAGDRGYALFAGRLSREKGLGVLLDAWRELSPWPLKIAGDGPLKATLAARIAEENLPIELLGMQSREALWRWLAGANLLIVPSIWFEGMPLVVLEALAMGVPVIGSRIGGLGEVLDDHACGLTFEPGDAKSLQVVARCVRDDAALRERLRASGRQKMADEFSAARSLQILESTYRAVIAERIAA